VRAEALLARPHVELAQLTAHSPSLAEALAAFPSEYLEQAEIQLKYAGYIEKEEEIADKMMRLDEVVIPTGFDYHRLKALSAEGREKLSKQRPTNLGQASRISGVSPADLSVLMVYMGR